MVHCKPLVSRHRRCGSSDRSGTALGAKAFSDGKAIWPVVVRCRRLVEGAGHRRRSTSRLIIDRRFVHRSMEKLKGHRVGVLRTNQPKWSTVLSRNTGSSRESIQDSRSESGRAIQSRR